jgi:integrase
MLKTRSGLPKFCSYQRARPGCEPRVRLRRDGKLICYLTGTPWSDDFMQQYAAALDGAAPMRAINAKAMPGSLGALIDSYDELVLPLRAEGTRAMRRAILKNFRAEHGHRSVAGASPEYLETIILKKATTAPHAANTLRKVLRDLFKHAIRLRLRKDNPMHDVATIKTKEAGHHSWTDAEIAQYRAYWALGTQQRLCFELALELTARRGNVVLLGPQHETADGKLVVHHNKGSKPSTIPIRPQLRAAIDAMGPIRHLTYLHTRHGAPRSAKALTGDFRRWCDLAKLPKHCVLHGLRHGGARRLANVSATTKEIMAMTGHKSIRIAQRYVDAADDVKLAERAVAKLNAEEQNGSARGTTSTLLSQKSKKSVI